MGRDRGNRLESHTLARAVGTSLVPLCAGLGIYLASHPIPWLLPIGEITGDVLLVGPEGYSDYIVPYRLAMFGLVGIGIPALVVASLRPRYRRHAAVVVGSLGLLVIGLQAISLGEALRHRAAPSFVLHYVLYDATTAGLLIALAFANRRPGIAGVALWVTGAVLTAASLGYVVAVSGADGLRQSGSSTAIVSAGSYVVAGASSLFVVGGAVLLAFENSVDGEIPSDGPGGTAPTSVFTLSIVAVGTALVGAQLPWLMLGSGEQYTTDLLYPGGPLSTVLTVGLAGTAAGSLVLVRSRRWRWVVGPLITTAGALLLFGSLLQYHLVWEGYSAPGLAITAGAGALLVVAGSLFSAVAHGLLSRPTSRADHGVVNSLRSPSTLVAVPGVALVVLGAWFDWLTPLPSSSVTEVSEYTAILDVHVATIVLLLVTVGVATATVAARRSEEAAGTGLLATGILSSAITLGWLVVTVGPEGVAGDALLIAPGPYVMLLGSGLLAVSGATRHTIAVLNRPSSDGVSDHRNRARVKAEGSN